MDDGAVRLTVQTPSLITLNVLADLKNLAAIMPKRLIEEANAGKKPVSRLIGTGPYKLAEFKQGEYLHLTRYDGYVSRSEPANGLSGQKKRTSRISGSAISPMSLTRLAGALTGEYDVIFDLPKDNIDALNNARDVRLYRPEAGGSLITYLFNKNRGPFADLKLRQAFNLALDVHQVLLAGYSDERFSGGFLAGLSRTGGLVQRGRQAVLESA